jgi:hypothetical protein
MEIAIVQARHTITPYPSIISVPMISVSVSVSASTSVSIPIHSLKTQGI